MYVYACIHVCMYVSMYMYVYTILLCIHVLFTVEGPGGWAIWLNGLPSGNKDFIIIIIIIIIIIVVVVVVVVVVVCFSLYRPQGPLSLMQRSK